jgi:lipopolysaccharide/colanic/teichoic acid biosynthesis glycosyltransferase
LPDGNQKEKLSEKHHQNRPKPKTKTQEKNHQSKSLKNQPKNITKTALKISLNASGMGVFAPLHCSYLFFHTSIFLWNFAV